MKSITLLAPTLCFLLFSCNSSEQGGSNKTGISKEQEAHNKAMVKEFDAENKTITLYTTSSDLAKKIEASIIDGFSDALQAREDEISVFINPEKQFQTHVGIGGAVTDASAEVFAKLSQENQKELLKAYFDKEKGLGYNIVRTSIHSCDFSSGSFTYVQEGDETLESFDISHDKEFRIPMIKQAMELIGDELMFYASPWSPPTYMKTNGNMLQGGKLKPEYRALWAKYYTKFIEAYEKEAIPVWGITIQNEPMATQRWESCIYTAEEERDFLRDYLGPIMEAAGYGDKKIVVWDHNRDLMSDRANVIFDDHEAAKYAWGIGNHWYENWTGGKEKHENLAKIKEAYPDKEILFTEGCNESFDSAKYYYWPNAERYIRNMINDFNAGSTGWTDWNILLDQNGGPNHVGNFCFAPVHGDIEKDELVFTPTFYAIGHFSKFVNPGAKRLSTTTSRSPILSVSYQNPDGSLAGIVYNISDEPINYRLYINRKAIELNIEGKSLQTVVVK